jgi:hypothetical protein
MHNTVQLPLRIHLLFASEGEAVQSDIAQMPEHRLDDADP